MRQVRAWIRRFVGTFRPDCREADMTAELESHLQFEIERNIDAGMSREEARRQAILAFGGFESAKEQYRDRYGIPTFAHLIQDARYGLRTFRRSPGFAAAAILTLGLGLGANMAIFRFVEAVLLESLPVPHPDRLVIFEPWSFNYPDVRDFASRNKDVLPNIAAHWPIRVNLTVDGSTEYVPGELVSGSYFDTLRVQPAVGRLLNVADDGAEGASAVCVIGYGLWQRRFGGDPGAVGRTIALNSKPFEIVGVTEPGFTGMDVHARHDIQIPMSMTEVFTGMKRDSASWSWLSIFGRLGPGVSHEHAEAAVRARFQPRHDWQKERPLILADGRQGTGSLRSRLEDPVIVAQLLSACVLIIACANLASLLLAKTSARRHEFAVRRSLGASRGRLVSQLFVESVLLAAAGAAVGTLVAVILDRVLAGMLIEPGSNMRFTTTPSPLGWSVSFGLLVLASLAIGSLPALIATRDAPLDGLRDAPRIGPRAGWLGRGLVVAQVVVCLVLVFAAGLFARSLHNLRTIDLGLDPRQVVVLTTDPERSGYSDERAKAFYGEWLRRARLVPGVSAVSLASVTAMSGGMFAASVRVPDAARRTGPEPNNNINVVTPDYFTTVGMPVVAGRGFTDADDRGAPPVAIVNERFVDYYWPGRSPLGRQITAFSRTVVTIVGVVRTAKYMGVREEPQITIYFPAAQRRMTELTLHARVSGGTSAVAAALARVVRDIDPRIPVYNAGALEDHVNARLANDRVLFVLSMLFAALALLVACAGVYGLVAYAVVRRTREIGIRLAVGAQRLAILRLFVADSVALVALGIAIGLPLSFAAGRKFTSVLYGIEPSSVSTLLAASAILATVGAVAAAVPAARGTRVDPIIALREP